jgi:hypothetical protein
MINSDRTDIRLLGQKHNQGWEPIHRLLRVIMSRAHGNQRTTCRLGVSLWRSDLEGSKRADRPVRSAPRGPAQRSHASVKPLRTPPVPSGMSSTDLRRRLPAGAVTSRSSVPVRIMEAKQPAWCCLCPEISNAGPGPRGLVSEPEPASLVSRCKIGSMVGGQACTAGSYRRSSHTVATAVTTVAAPTAIPANRHAPEAANAGGSGAVLVSQRLSSK